MCRRVYVPPLKVCSSRIVIYKELTFNSGGRHIPKPDSHFLN